MASASGAKRSPALPTQQLGIKVLREPYEGIFSPNRPFQGGLLPVNDFLQYTLNVYDNKMLKSKLKARDEKMEKTKLSMQQDFKSTQNFY